MYFIDFTVEDLELMRRKSGSTTKAFNKRKVTLIYNVIRYYDFLADSDPNLQKDPKNWSMSDFEKWIQEGRHPTVASFQASKANAKITAPSTITTPATVCPDTKKAENAWLSWQRCTRKVDRYSILTKDRDYNS